MHEVGQRVLVRGMHWQVLDASDPDSLLVIGRTPANDGLKRRFLIGVDEIAEAEPPALHWTLDKHKPNYLQWRAFHDAFRLTMAHGRDYITALERGRLVFEPYQFEPLIKLMKLPFPRLLIADDVGLGKTAEAGLILLELLQRHRANRILVLCKAGLVPEQWQREMIEKFGLDFTIFDHDGIRRYRREKQVPAHINIWSAADRVITSYDYAKQDHVRRQLDAVRWDMVVIDECHNLAGDSQRGELAQKIADQTEGLLLLSATPHDGKSESFAGQLRLLDRYLVADDEKMDPAVVARVMIRRLKTKVIKASGERFAERQLHTIAIDFTPAEAALDKAVRSYAKALAKKAQQAASSLERQQVQLAASVLLKRLISSPYAIRRSLEHRLSGGVGAAEETAEDNDQSVITTGVVEPDEAKTLISLIDKARKIEAGTDCKSQAILKFLAQRPDQKVIIFTEFRDSLTYINEVLGAAGFDGKTITFHGGLSEKERKYVQQQFLDPEGPRVLIATDAASEALNFQATCHIILHNELPWNPNRLEQRNGRIDRYGQGINPQIYNLHIRQSHESRVLDVINKKLDTIRRDLGSISAVLGMIGDRDLDAVMRSESPADPETLAHVAEAFFDHEIARVKDSMATWEGERVLAGTAFGREEERGVLEVLDRSRAFVPSYDEVEALIRDAFRAYGGSVQPITEPGIVSVKVPPRFQREGLPVTMPRVTFSRDRAVAKADTEFLSPGHPLVQGVLRELRGLLYDASFASRLCWRFAAEGERGILYTFFMRFLDGRGELLEEWLEPVFVSLATRKVSRASEQDRALFLAPPLNRNIQANAPEVFAPYRTAWDACFDAATKEAGRRQAERLKALTLRQGQIAQRYMADVTAWRAARTEFLERRLRKVTDAQISFLDQGQRRALRRDQRERAALEAEVIQRLEEIERMAKVQADKVLDPLGALLILKAE